MVALVLCHIAVGCSSTSKKAPAPPEPPRVLRVTHQLGGTHYRTALHENVWYQAFDDSLLVINPDDPTLSTTVELGEPGETGPATDMLILQRPGQTGQMYVVIEDDQIIELSLASPMSPSIVRRLDAAQLGIRPRRLSQVDGVAYVSGRGGVVRLSDQAVVLRSNKVAGPVVKSGHGLVAPGGGEVRRLADGRMVAAADELIEIPATLLGPGGHAGESSSADAFGRASHVFVRSGSSGSLIGLMQDDLRELTTPGSRLAATSVVNRVRFVGDRLWILTDASIAAYAVDPAAPSITETMWIDSPSAGARDLDRLNESTMALGGSAGRALLRTTADETGPAGSFYKTHREPGRLRAAVTDGQHILASSADSMWVYLINARVERTTRTFDNPPAPGARSAATTSVQAVIGDDGASVELTGPAAAALRDRLALDSSTSDAAVALSDDAWVYSEPEQCAIHTVVAVDGDLWLGHDRGITVLRTSKLAPLPQGDDEAAAAVLGAPHEPVVRLRIPGPVIYVYPLLIGGGASFVSENGGFGVAEWVVESQPARR